jgi:hypothetical protein
MGGFLKFSKQLHINWQRLTTSSILSARTVHLQAIS